MREQMLVFSPGSGMSPSYHEITAVREDILESMPGKNDLIFGVGSDTGSINRMYNRGYTDRERGPSIPKPLS